MKSIFRGQGLGVRGQGVALRCFAAFLLAGAAWAQQPAEKPKAEEQTPAAPAKTEEKAGEAPAPKADEKAPAAPAPSAETWLTGYADFGYRWVTGIAGNFQQYRSVVNLGEGPKLFGFDFTIHDPNRRLFDTFTARGMGWGGDPYSTAHVDASKGRLYDLRFDYRNIGYFDAVPSFANPTQPAGFNEQSFDIRRRAASFDLDLWPGSQITPFLAFERNAGHGRGISTWVLGATDEFPIPYALRDSTNNYRGGVRLEFNRWHLTLEQGGTTFKENDDASYTGPNSGDRTLNVTGGPLNLGSLQQTYGIGGHSVYTRALATAHPASWMNVYGQFLYSIPKTDVSYTEVAAGRLLDPLTQLLFATQLGIAGGNAVQPHVSGNFGIEARWRRIHLMESLTTDREHDSATGLFNQALFQSTPATPASTAALLNPRQVVRYNQAETDLLYDLTSKLTLRGGYRYLRGDAVVLAGNLSQTGTQLSGELHRSIGMAGLAFRPSSKISANFDYEGASSDHTYFRGSLNDYSKARIRAKYQASNSLLFQANFQILNNSNPAPDIRLDYESRSNILSVFWTPGGGRRLSVTGEYDRTTLSSSIRYLDLPFLTPATSLYRENAHTATGALELAIPGIPAGRISAGGSLFISNGSRSTSYYQPLAKLVIPVHKHLQWNTQWQYYGFGESFFLFEGFRTHVFTTGLRVSQ